MCDVVCLKGLPDATSITPISFYGSAAGRRGGGKRCTLTTLNFYSVVARARCEVRFGREGYTRDERPGVGETTSLKRQTLNYIFIRISRKQHSGGLEIKK